MSISALENAVEQAVAIIIAKGNNKKQNRNLLASLFRFCDRHDTKFTRFRTMQQLVDGGFIYRLPLSSHPRFKRYRKEIEKAYRESGDLAWLNGEGGVFPDVAGKKAGYDIPAYMSRNSDKKSHLNPGFYVEAGSSAWKELVASKVLKGADAVRPTLLSPVELALALAHLDANAEDGFLAGTFYGLIGGLETDRSLEQLKSNKALRLLRDLASQQPKAVQNIRSLVESSPMDLAAKEWWLDIVPSPRTATGAIAKALRRIANPPADFAEMPPTASSYIESVIGNAVKVLEAASKPPLEDLFALLSHSNPWIPVYASRILYRHRKAVAEETNYEARLKSILHRLDEIDERLCRFEDSKEESVRSYLIKLLADLGSKSVASVLQHADQKLKRRGTLDAECAIALFAGGKIKKQLWRELVALQTKASASRGSSVFSESLYSFINLAAMCSNGLPITDEEFVSLVKADQAALCARARFLKNPLDGLLCIILQRLSQASNSLCQSLSKSWAAHLIPWLEKAADAPLEHAKELQYALLVFQAEDRHNRHALVSYLHVDRKTLNRARRSVDKLSAWIQKPENLEKLCARAASTSG